MHSVRARACGRVTPLADDENPLAFLLCAGALEDDALDIMDIALRLAALDDPTLPLARSAAHVEGLIVRARDAGARAQSARAQAIALAQVLYEEAGYEGDRTDYDHPDNANIARVIERRRGLPVALGLLYIHIGRQLGWDVHGLAVPGHFVVRVAAGTERVIIDPFNGGAQIDTPQLRLLLKRALGPDAELSPNHLAEVSNRDVLVRLQNNIKARALAQRDLVTAARLLERMTLLAPAEANLWYERGVIEGEIGHLAAAAAALKACLEHACDVTLKQNARTALSELRRKLN